MPARLRYLLAVAIGGLWLVSLCLPALAPDGPGVVLLLTGSVGVFAGEIGWLANPLLGVLVYILWRPRPQRDHGLLICAMVFAVALWIEATRTTIFNGGARVPVERFAGYYVWTAAIALGMVAALLQWKLTPPRIRAQAALPTDPA